MLGIKVFLRFNELPERLRALKRKLTLWTLSVAKKVAITGVTLNFMRKK